MPAPPSPSGPPRSTGRRHRRLSGARQHGGPGPPRGRARCDPPARGDLSGVPGRQGSASRRPSSTSHWPGPTGSPHTSMDVQRILVRVTARDGVTGTGEGVVPGDPWWGGESVETMRLVVERYLTPLLLGRRVDDIAGIKRATNDVVTANPARRPPSRPPARRVGSQPRRPGAPSPEGCTSPTGRGSGWNSTPPPSPDSPAPDQRGAEHAVPRPHGRRRPPRPRTR